MSKKAFDKNIDKELLSAHLDTDEEMSKPLSEYEQDLSDRACERLKKRQQQEK